MSVPLILPAASLFLFASSSVLVFAGFQQRGWCQRLAFYGFVVATLAITVDVLIFSRASASLLTMAVAWVGIISVFFFNIRAIISFLAPFATLILLWQVASPSFGVPSADGVLINLHIVLAVCGEAFAIGACGLSLLYLWQRHILKKKLLRLINVEMSALDRIGNSLEFCLLAGFVFLTAGLLSGAFYSKFHSQSLQEGLQLKIIWAVAVWVWYLAILISKNVLRSSHRNIACMSLAGFGLLALSFFGLLFFKHQGGA